MEYRQKIAESRAREAEICQQRRKNQERIPEGKARDAEIEKARRARRRVVIDLTGDGVVEDLTED